jgi:hypothetical protein
LLSTAANSDNGCCSVDTGSGGEKELRRCCFGCGGAKALEEVMRDDEIASSKHTWNGTDAKGAHMSFRIEMAMSKVFNY